MATRRRTSTAAGAVLLLASLGLPTAEARPEQAAITDVRIAWADTQLRAIKVTWSETGQLDNTVQLVVIDGEAPGRRLGTVQAADGDAFVVPTEELQSSTVRAERLRVVVADAAAPATEGRSVEFDRYLAAPPSVSVALTSDQQVRWTVPADTSRDSTPGDPLDVDGPPRFVPRRWMDVGAAEVCDMRLLPVVVGTTGTLAPPGRAYRTWITAVNEWGQALGNPVVVSPIGKSITITAPAATRKGSKTTITGLAEETTVVDSATPPNCLVPDSGVYDRPVILHQRTSATAPWTVVGTTRTDEFGRYTAVVTNPGDREYRVVRANAVVAGPTVGNVAQVDYGGPASPVVRVRSVS